MEQKEILEHLVAIRTLILDSVPMPRQGYENSGKNIPEAEFEAWGAGYSQGFQNCKTLMGNIINKEINTIIGVNIIGMKTCNQKTNSA